MKKYKILWSKYSSHPIYNNLIESLKKNFYNIEFFIASKKLIFKNEKIKFEYLSIGKKILKIPGTERTPNLEKIFNKIKPNIIITNLYYSLYSYKAYKYAKRNNLKLIINTEEKHKKTIIRKILFPIWDYTVGKKMLNYKNTLILAWSKDSYKFMKNLVKNKNKVKLFLAGIDTKFFYINKINKKTESLNILMVARIIPCKDHITLLKALNKIKNENILNFKLTLLGKTDTKFKNTIIKKINKYNLENNINVIDKIPHNQVVNIYNSHDILILPSKSEAVGLVVPEAMASGLPVIISDSVGAKDYVIENENGLIFKTGDHNDLANKIIKISKMDLEKMGKNANLHIKNNYNIEKVANYFYDLITN